MRDSDDEDPAKLVELKKQSMDDFETLPMHIDTQVFSNALIKSDEADQSKAAPSAKVTPGDDAAFGEFLKVSPPPKVGCLKLLLLFLFEQGWWDHFLLRSFSLFLFNHFSFPVEVITRAEQLGVKHAHADDDAEAGPKSKKPKRGRKPKKGKGKKADKKNLPAEPAKPEKTQKVNKKPACSRASAASSSAKPLRGKKDQAPKRKADDQVGTEPKVKQPNKKVEKPQEVAPAELEQDAMPKTFARRYCPDNGIGRKKWRGIVTAFTQLIVPSLEAGTKTKAEVDFWRFATQFHKDHGNSADEKIMANVFAMGAKEFLTFLNTVPLAKLVSNNLSFWSFNFSTVHPFRVFDLKSLLEALGWKSYFVFPL